MSALFRWPCSISIHVSRRSVTAGVRPLTLACSTSIHLSPRSVPTGVRPFPLATQHFYSYVSQVCHCWRPPFSVGHVALLYSCVSQVCRCWCPAFSAGHIAFLFICFPGLSLVSALFLWPCILRRPCSISVRLSSRSVAATFQHICLPGLSLVVSALFRWPCSISIRSLLSPRFGARTAGVRPFPLSMQHFYSFGSNVISLNFSPRFGACTGVRLLPLAMQHIYSFVSQVMSLLLSS